MKKKVKKDRERKEKEEKGGKEKNRVRKILFIILGAAILLFFVLPGIWSFFGGLEMGNVALIQVEGVITGSGGSYLGQATVSSETIVGFLEEAEKNKMVKGVLLEVNSPGGGAVASDEIAGQIKKMKKPVVAVIREVGASGGYWVASACDYVVANRMSITGSIGVISSYLEFSELMEKYGIGYERLVAGEKKDIGEPFRKLSEEERVILQKKLDKIHDFFIKEIAENRGLEEEKVREIATGEFLLGVEALEEGLVDELGGREEGEKYLKEKAGLEKIDYVRYEVKRGLLETMLGVVSDYFFRIGEGIGSVFVREGNRGIWV